MAETDSESLSQPRATAAKTKPKKKLPKAMQPSMADNSDDEMPPLQMIPLPGKLVILAVMQKCYIFVAL